MERLRKPNLLERARIARKDRDRCAFMATRHALFQARTGRPAAAQMDRTNITARLSITTASQPDKPKHGLPWRRKWHYVLSIGPRYTERLIAGERIYQTVHTNLNHIMLSCPQSGERRISNTITETLRLRLKVTYYRNPGDFYD
jgi:hypothetical protein